MQIKFPDAQPRGKRSRCPSRNNRERPLAQRYSASIGTSSTIAITSAARCGCWCLRNRIPDLSLIFELTTSVE